MSRLRTLAACGIAAALFLPSGVSASDPQAVWRQRESQGAGVVPEDVREEITFGREVAARIIGRYGLYENSEVTKYVNLVGRMVAVNTNRPEIDFRFAVLNTDEINGYAAPGGYIFVTRGALGRMQDEAELAGVLAHEVSHVANKDIVKELNIHGSEESPTSGLARMIGGATDTARVAFSQAVDKAIDILFKNGYKREDEVRADKTAVTVAAIAGYDPAGLPRYLERIGAVKGKGTEVLDSTHPSTTERVAWIRATIQEEGMEGGFKTSKDRFADMMKKVR